MNHEALADELNALLNSESHSIASQVITLTPHLTPSTFRVWRNLEAMAHASAEHARTLSGLINRLELPVRAGHYPLAIGDYNFMNVEALLPPIIEEKQRQIAAYERALIHAADRPDVVAILRTMLETNRAQLESLRSHHQSLATV